ncbi:MAG: malate--CoA ligase subunit beta [Geminicoccaceae bacterium]|nr:malate--CoA ligase subunit beta [Geminicoccaceae bacterium]
MDIHEYQAKELLARHGVVIPRGELAYSPEQAVLRARETGGSAWVVKGQVHSGARGKAGGIKFCKDPHEVWNAADTLLGKRLVTHQTGPKGKPIFRLYVEAAARIERELYLGFVLDRQSERIMVIASAEGGTEIEDVAAESIHRVIVEPAVGLQAFQARALAFKLGCGGDEMAQMVQTMLGAYRTFRDLDATMIEINPLVVTEEKAVVALDCKMSFDDNALYRHPDIAELRDRSQEDPREGAALDRGLSYVGLDGTIGCMINGAGLAMATMDMIMLAGGRPANFLDIGGGATPDRVAKAFRLVQADDNVKVILVNIFAGINRCDWVAKGIVEAVGATKLRLPLVVRLAGTNVEEGRRVLAESGLAIVSATTLAEAAEKAVAAAKATETAGTP